MEPQAERDGKISKTTAMIGAAVLLVVLGGIYFFATKIQKAKIPVPDSGLYSGPVVTKAPAGELVGNFPSDYILEKDAAVEESAFLNYNTAGQKLYTASYVSKLNIDAAFAGYKKYFSNSIGGGWKITNSGDTPSHKFLFAQSSDRMTQVSVDVSKENNAVKVGVAVLQK